MGIFFCFNPIINYCIQPITNFIRGEYIRISLYFKVWKRERSVKHYIQIIQGLSSLSFLLVYIISSFFREYYLIVLVLEYLATIFYLFWYISDPPFYLYKKKVLAKDWNEFNASRRAIWENLTCRRVRKQKRDSSINHLTSMMRSIYNLSRNLISSITRNPFSIIDSFNIPFTLILLTANAISREWLYRNFFFNLSGALLLCSEWIRVLRGVTVLRLVIYGRGRSVMQQIIIFILSVIGLVCFFSSFIDVVENIYRKNVFSPSRYHKEIIQLFPNWDSMTVEEQVETGYHTYKEIISQFYTIICVQTLGSEVDTLNDNYATKISLVVFHITFIFIVAQQAATIYALVMKGSSFFGKPNLSGHFIVECSDATPEEIQDFLVEFYNPTHGIDARAADVLLVVDNPTKSDNMRRATSNRYFAERVSIHIGDIRQWKFFDFISADHAEAIFIFVNPNARDRKRQDTIALMKSMAITSFSQVKVFSMVIDPQNVPLFKQAKVQSILCINDIKLKMMTKSLIVPGFSTIIGNLVHAAEVKRKSTSEKMGSYWVDSYLEGIRNELYVVQMFSQKYWGCLFHEVVREAFVDLNILLLGVVHKGEILLNPSNDTFKISNFDKPIIIARDLIMAQRISINTEWVNQDDDDIRPQLIKSPSVRKEEDVIIDKRKSKKEIEVTRLSGQIARRFSLSSTVSTGALGLSKKEKAEKRIEFEIQKIFTRSKPSKFDEFMYDPAKSSMNFENHYIILGDLSDALFIIFSIRKQLSNKKSKYDTESEEIQNPIILVGENESIAHQLYEKCKYFDSVYFFIGDPTDTVDLRNLNVEKAHSIMYLCLRKEYSEHPLITESVNDEELVDGFCIRVVLALHHISKNLKLIVELVHKSSLILLQDYKEYLLARNMKKFSNVRLKIPHYIDKRIEVSYLQSVMFASGQALVTKAIFPRLFCQAYFMPDIVEVVECMCGIIPSEKSKLVHIVKPPMQLIGKTYFEVFDHMLKVHRVILIAWFCGLGPRQQPFVFIAPDRHCAKILSSTDQLFVVGRPDEEDEHELVSHIQGNDPFKFGDVLFRMKNRHGTSTSSTETPISPNSESTLLRKKLEYFSSHPIVSEDSNDTQKDEPKENISTIYGDGSLIEDKRNSKDDTKKKRLSFSLPNRIKSLTTSQRNLLTSMTTSSSDSVDSTDITLKVLEDGSPRPSPLVSQNSMLSVREVDSIGSASDVDDKLTPKNNGSSNPKIVNIFSSPKVMKMAESLKANEGQRFLTTNGSEINQKSDTKGKKSNNKTKKQKTKPKLSVETSGLNDSKKVDTPKTPSENSRSRSNSSAISTPTPTSSTKVTNSITATTVITSTPIPSTPTTTNSISKPAIVMNTATPSIASSTKPTTTSSTTINQSNSTSQSNATSSIQTNSSPSNISIALNLSNLPKISISPTTTSAIAKTEDSLSSNNSIPNSNGTISSISNVSSTPKPVGSTSSVPAPREGWVSNNSSPTNTPSNNTSSNASNLKPFISSATSNTQPKSTIVAPLSQTKPTNVSNTLNLSNSSQSNPNSNTNSNLNSKNHIMDENSSENSDEENSDEELTETEAEETDEDD